MPVRRGAAGADAAGFVAAGGSGRAVVAGDDPAGGTVAVGFAAGLTAGEPGGNDGVTSRSRTESPSIAPARSVSRSAASGSRYAPMESTRSVSRLARARSAAKAESAAI